MELDVITIVLGRVEVFVVAKLVVVAMMVVDASVANPHMQSPSRLTYAENLVIGEVARVVVASVVSLAPFASLVVVVETATPFP